MIRPKGAGREDGGFKNKYTRRGTWGQTPPRERKPSPKLVFIVKAPRGRKKVATKREK